VKLNEFAETAIGENLNFMLSDKEAALAKLYSPKWWAK